MGEGADLLRSEHVNNWVELTDGGYNGSQDLDRLIPNGWLRDYINYAETLTDAPSEFHLMTGLTLLSVAAGNSITYRGFGGGEHWCNLYALIIAPTGFFRKSTALSIGRRIIGKANKGLILPNEQTRERFLTELKEKPTAILFISEFAAQLSLWGREYMGGMKEIITELYDPMGQYIRQTMKAEKVIINKPSLSILAATTSDWLVERLTAGDIRGGLMGRFLICPASEKTKWQGLPEMPSDSIEDDLATRLGAISNIECAKVSLDGIKEKLNRWLKTIEALITQKANPETAGFTSRMGNHLVKIATLYHISKIGVQNKYEIDDDSLTKAINLISYLLHGLETLTRTTLTLSKTEQDLQRLLQRIKQDGGITHRELLRYSHMKIRDFQAMINTLIDRGEIKSTLIKTPGRPAFKYETVTEQ
jgi:hypothetical protein